MSARLVITDGITTVNLLGAHAYLKEWRPSVAGYKGSGLYADSPLADGRRLVDRRFDNAVETFELVFADDNQDTLISWTRTLRRLLEQAADYWVSGRAARPVWLEAKASRETNTRYALVISGRMEDDDGPFRQPFLQFDCRAVMDGMTLLVERGHWMESKPGVGACLPLLVRPDFDSETYLEEILSVTYPPIAVWPFNDTSGSTARNYSQYGNLLDGGYTASMILADLMFHTGEDVAFVPVVDGAVNIYSSKLASLIRGDRGSFTMWMRSSGLIWNDGDEHYLLYLYEDANNYISLRKTTTDNQLRAEIMNDGVLRAASGTVPPLTGEWVSVGMVWNAAGASKLVLFINGAGVGVNFVPFPGVDISINTAIIGSEDLPGGGATPGLSSHIAYAALWNEPLPNEDMWKLLSRPYPPSDETSCDGVFVANKQSEGRISHVYVADTSLGTFSVNLVDHDYDSGSAALFPVSPAAADFLYIGSSTTTVPAGGPFSNAIFDLDTSGYDCYQGAWEYWNGAAWTTLTTQDNTNVLNNPGVHSVHWLQPSNWAATSINSVTAYWIRLNPSAIGSCDVPRQQNRPPYTAVRPYLDIAEGDVPGDIPALLSLRLTGWADGESGSPSIYANRLHVGLRSLSRGEGFAGYINLADRHNAPGITITAGSSTTFTTDARSPSGRSSVYNPGGAEAIATRVTVDIAAGLAADFIGAYRAFIRARCTGGSTTFTARLVVGDGTYLQTFASQSVEAGGDDLISFNMGLVHLPTDLLLPPTETAGNIQIEVQAGSDNGTDNLNFYDLILIPVDEMAISADDAIRGALLSAINQIGYTTQDNIGRTRIHLDSLVWPKGVPRAILESVSLNGQAVARWQLISPPDLFLQANEGQRLWLYFERDRSIDIALPNVQGNVHEMTVGAVALRQARYLSMRGDG